MQIRAILTTKTLHCTYRVTDNWATEKSKIRKSLDTVALSSNRGIADLKDFSGSGWGGGEGSPVLESLKQSCSNIDFPSICKLVHNAILAPAIVCTI